MPKKHFYTPEGKPYLRAMYRKRKHKEKNKMVIELSKSIPWTNLPPEYITENLSTEARAMFTPNGSLGIENVDGLVIITNIEASTLFSSIWKYRKVL